MELIGLLTDLCMKNGISGDEKNVRDYICSRLDSFSDICEYHIDPLGNVIANVKGYLPAKHKLLINAHMDEVGLIVTNICSDGTLKFDTVGGIDPRVLFGKRVYIGDNAVLGIIGSTAVHNLSDEERSKALSVQQMSIDIGCSSREEAEKLVQIGDCICFESGVTLTGKGSEHCVISKAIDDRAGCSIMLKLIEDGLKYDTCFSFAVQEEVGLRGSKTAAYTVDPEFAIVLEATTAADIPSSNEEKRVCEVGKGPVVSYMDKATIYDRELYKLAFSAAKQLGIPCQTKTVIAGGNDSGSIHVSRNGVRTAAISLPCRYLHSPSSLIAESDLLYAYDLTCELINKIQEL